MTSDEALAQYEAGYRSGRAVGRAEAKAARDQLREALSECAADLEAEIAQRYDGLLPALEARFDRDMLSVRAAHRALEVSRAKD